MSNSTPQVPPPEDETAFAHIIRSMKNGMTKCFGCLQTSDEKAKIKYKEYQIETHKKTFGVNYINMVLESATEQALKECVDGALADIEVINKEIEVLQKEIERVEGVVKSKLITKPAGTPTAQPATTTVPAAPAAVEPVPATATEQSPAEVDPVSDVATPDVVPVSSTQPTSETQ